MRVGVDAAIELPGVLHNSIGQEAEIVGACMALRDQDYMTGNHRSHGHPIGKGVKLAPLMAELFGKSTGVCRGKGGSMHLAAFAAGSLGESGIVGSLMPVAVGAGLSARLRGTDQVCLCFFGDGAANCGPFHESLNLAAIWKLQVVFLCENNGYAIHTSQTQMCAVANMADRASAYGIPGVVMDGQDILSVYDGVLAAVARARSGVGPSLVETKTYRYCERSESGGIPKVPSYRSEDEVAEWRARDPIELFCAQLVSTGKLTSDEATAIRAEVDPRVFVMGQEVQTGIYAAVMKELGAERVRNTPISEAGFYGAGIGAALTGMRPVIEAAFSTFFYSAMDQIVNQAAKSRYMFGGQANVPLVIRSFVAYGISTAAHHSDRPWGLFAQVPGLKIIVPTTAYDAKGLLRSAIRDGNPMLCFDDFGLLNFRGEVPDGDYTIPLGVADVKRAGSDLTIVTLAAAVHHSIAAAETLQREGYSVEVIDIRTVAPLDRKTILDSVKKTGRLLAVDAAPGTCSLASEVVALAAERAFSSLKSQVIRLTTPDVPVPFSPDLECLMYPTPVTIAAAARRLLTERPDYVFAHTP